LHPRHFITTRKAPSLDMDPRVLVLSGRVLFAVALASLGAQHIIFDRFVVGRAPPWSTAESSGSTWIIVSGLTLSACGLAILRPRIGRAAALFAATLVLIWALLRHIPVVMASEFLSASWTDAAKALRFIGGALAVAATLPAVGWIPDERYARFVDGDAVFARVGAACIGFSLMVNGAQHFTATPFVAGLIPAWFPGDASFWTYFGGVALIAGGIGLLMPRTLRLAALMSGLMVFSWFWIIHVPRARMSVSAAIAVFEALLTSGSLFVVAGWAWAATRAHRR
jgi:uncharacterized membrane protein